MKFVSSALVGSLFVGVVGLGAFRKHEVAFLDAPAAGFYQHWQAEHRYRIGYQEGYRRAVSMLSHGRPASIRIDGDRFGGGRLSAGPLPADHSLTR